MNVETAQPGEERQASVLMNIARVAKVAALLGFLLPWVTVSCATRPLAQATGFDLAVGRVTMLDDGIGRSGLLPIEDYIAANVRPDLFVIAAAALILIGLILTYLHPRRRAALAGMAAAVASLGCLLFEFLVRVPAMWQDPARDAALARSGVSALSPAMRRELDSVVDRIAVHAGSGFWITTVALAVAIAFLAAAMWQPRRV